MKWWRQYVKGNDIKEGMLNRVESAICCCDSCLSCSTHALGQMPTVIEVRDVTGEQVKVVKRG